MSIQEAAAEMAGFSHTDHRKLCHPSEPSIQGRLCPCIGLRHWVLNMANAHVNNTQSLGTSSGPHKLLVEESILCLMASSKESQVASSLLYLCHARR